MTSTTTLLFPLSLGLAAIACGNPSPASGTSADAGGDDGAIHDAALDVSAADAPSNGDAGGLVAQCQAAARHFATLCAGDDVRPCMWNAYAGLCATGQTQLLVDSMNCLDSTVCRTFSDANQGNACLATVHQAGETSAAKAVVAQYCTTCGGSNCSAVTGQMEIYPYLSDDELAALGACDGGAVCTSGVVTCPGTPEVSPFLACVSGDR